jgi:hypothetical protein
MKMSVLLAVALVVAASPSMAKSYHHHHHLVGGKAPRHRVYAEKPANSHAQVTCEMVRAYVAQVGQVQARAMALSAGMTASEERRAIHCLENGA